MLLREFSCLKGQKGQTGLRFPHLGHEQENVLWCFSPLYPRLVSEALSEIILVKVTGIPAHYFLVFELLCRLYGVFSSFCSAPQHALNSSVCSLFLRTEGCSFHNKCRAESRGLHLRKGREESICGRKFFPSLSAVPLSVLFSDAYPSEPAWRSYLVLIQKMRVSVPSPGSTLSGLRSTVYVRWQVGFVFPYYESILAGYSGQASLCSSVRYKGNKGIVILMVTLQCTCLWGANGSRQGYCLWPRLIWL